MALEKEYGIERVISPQDFDSTIERLETILKSKGLSIFAKIDFSGDAKRAGLDMPRTLLLIFGNPKAGTPVMLAAPSSALDLPLKVLISESNDGKVWVSYNTPEFLSERHAIPADLAKNIAGIRAVVQAASSAATA